MYAEGAANEQFGERLLHCYRLGEVPRPGLIAVVGAVDRPQLRQRRCRESQSGRRSPGTVPSSGMAEAKARALWLACGRGDAAAAAAQLDGGAKIDAREPNVRPAARPAPAEPLRLCLCSWLTRWCPPQCQGTALYFAALNNHLEVVALLLERNADVNVANKSGQTPLHVAQSEEVAQALLDAECEDGSMAADTSLRNRWGKTAEEYNSMLGRVGFKGIEGREAVATKITAVLDARHEAQWAGPEGEAEEEAPA